MLVNLHKALLDEVDLEQKSHHLSIHFIMLQKKPRGEKMGEGLSAGFELDLTFSSLPTGMAHTEVTNIAHPQA